MLARHRTNYQYTSTPTITHRLAKPNARTTPYQLPIHVNIHNHTRTREAERTHDTVPTTNTRQHPQSHTDSQSGTLARHRTNYQYTSTPTITHRLAKPNAHTTPYQLPIHVNTHNHTRTREAERTHDTVPTTNTRQHPQSHTDSRSGTLARHRTNYQYTSTPTITHGLAKLNARTTPYQLPIHVNTHNHTRTREAERSHDTVPTTNTRQHPQSHTD